MESIRHVSASVESLLAASLPDLPQAVRRRLQFFVLGVLLAGTVVLRRVATTQALVRLCPTTAPSHERRLRRTLNDHVVQAAPTYGRVVRRVLRHLAPTQRVILVVDESGHTAVVRVLLAALVIRGRALPLSWVLWPAQQPHTQAYWTDTATLLADVAALLPPGLPVTVVADRAFGCPAFTDQVQAQGWDYVVRVQGQTRLRHADGHTQPLRAVVPTPGTRWRGCGQVFKQQGWRTAQVVAYWRRGCGSPLLLVTSLPAQWRVVWTYRRRASVEALFRDWKSSGWQWERSQVRDVAHQRALVVVLALATLVTLVLGQEAAAQHLVAPRQAGHRRPWAARDSVFRLGRDRLWARIWQEDRTAIWWAVTEADPTPWGETCWQAALPTPLPVNMTERVGKREHLRSNAA